MTGSTPNDARGADCSPLNDGEDLTGHIAGGKVARVRFSTDTTAAEDSADSSADLVDGGVGEGGRPATQLPRFSSRCGWLVLSAISAMSEPTWNAGSLRCCSWGTDQPDTT